MIDVNALRGEIARNGYRQSDIAKKIGIAPKTFSEKMKKGVFGSDEIEVMIQVLHIADPVSIFFAGE